MRRPILTGVAGAVFVGALALLGACTGSAPEILYPDTQLFLSRNPQSGETAEILRLFAAVRDPDGADDPARIFVVSDGAELFWEFSKEEWVAVDHAGDQWYGVPEIRMPDGEDLPRGPYRLIVEDAGLSRDESTFFIGDEPEPRGAPFPQLRVEGDVLTVDYGTAVVLRVYGRAGELILSSAVEPGPLPGEIAKQIPEQSGLVAFLSTVGAGSRRETGPIPLRR